MVESSWIGRRLICVREYNGGLSQRNVEAEVSTLAGDEQADRVDQLVDQRDLKQRTWSLYWKVMQ